MGEVIHTSLNQWLFLMGLKLSDVYNNNNINNNKVLFYEQYCNGKILAILQVHFGENRTGHGPDKRNHSVRSNQ